MRLLILDDEERICTLQMRSLGYGVTIAAPLGT
jgi:hypothetical protein